MLCNILVQLSWNCGKRGDITKISDRVLWHIECMAHHYCVKLIDKLQLGKKY